MSTILNVLLLICFPFTWFGKLKEKIWLYGLITFLNLSLCITYFIEGKWGFGLLFVISSLLWGLVTYLKYRKKKLDRDLAEVRAEMDELLAERQEILTRLQDIVGRLHGVDHSEEEKKEIKPKKDIKKFKL